MERLGLFSFAVLDFPGLVPGLHLECSASAAPQQIPLHALPMYYTVLYISAGSQIAGTAYVTLRILSSVDRYHFLDVISAIMTSNRGQGDQ